MKNSSLTLAGFVATTIGLIVGVILLFNMIEYSEESAEAEKAAIKEIAAQEEAAKVARERKLASEEDAEIETEDFDSENFDIDQAPATAVSPTSGVLALPPEVTALTEEEKKKQEEEEAKKKSEGACDPSSDYYDPNSCDQTPTPPPNPTPTPLPTPTQVPGPVCEPITKENMCACEPEKHKCECDTAYYAENLCNECNPSDPSCEEEEILIKEPEEPPGIANCEVEPLKQMQTTELKESDHKILSSEDFGKEIYNLYEINMGAVNSQDLSCSQIKDDAYTVPYDILKSISLDEYMGIPLTPDDQIVVNYDTTNLSYGDNYLVSMFENTRMPASDAATFNCLCQNRVILEDFYYSTIGSGGMQVDGGTGTAIFQGRFGSYGYFGSDDGASTSGEGRKMGRREPSSDETPPFLESGFINICN